VNSRKPIYVMLFVGVLVILSLTFLPYSLVQRARNAVAGFFHTQPPSESVAAEEIPAPPAFDVAAWYADRKSVV
jgi:hypothetical protein